MTLPRTTSILIVGAGPTGLSLACQLARYGIDFTVIDAGPGLTPFSKAIGVHARTLEIYEQMGLAERAVSEGAIARKGRLIVHGKVRGELELEEIGAGFSPYPYVLMLEQSKNEQLLYDHLGADQARVHWGTAFESLQQIGGAVVAKTRSASGEVSEIRADYVVGCDGARSPVRHALGLEFEGSTFERTFYVADAKVDWTLSHDALQAFMAKGTFLLFFPLKGEARYRIVGVFPEEFAEDADSLKYERIEARIRDETELPIDIHDVEWFSTYKVHSRHVSSFRAGRCLLAGDAAHIHSPAGAQGMNTGIQDAYNLAWKLALVLRGMASDALLDSYSTERLANAKRLLETTDRMFHLAASDSAFVSFMRLNVMPHIAGRLLRNRRVTSALFPVLSQIGIHYPDSSLSDHTGDDKFDVKAGDRMPWLRIDGRSVYDDLRAPRFHLVIFGMPAPDLSALGDACDAVSYAFNSEAADAFGAKGPFGVLLRPDNYIALIGSEVSASTVRLYLDGLRQM